MEYMKKAGIFIICAQSFMHFTAGKTYEKYVRLLIGIMILGQFIVPVRAVFLGGENAVIWEEIERFQKELEAAVQEVDRDMAEAMGSDGERMEAAGSGMEKRALEEEIKERLSDAASAYERTIEEVEITEDASKIIVTVRRMEEGGGGMGTIKVDKITVGQEIGQEIGRETGQVTGMAEEMAEDFSKVLGIDADYLEIIER